MQIKLWILKPASSSHIQLDVSSIPPYDTEPFCYRLSRGLNRPHVSLSFGHYEVLKTKGINMHSLSALINGTNGTAPDLIATDRFQFVKIHERFSIAWDVSLLWPLAGPSTKPFVIQLSSD